MTDNKKRRGRPVGTDYKNDKIALKLVAERLAAHPTLRPMTAMKAVFDTKAFSGRGFTQRDTTVSRWQAKWKTEGEALLRAARMRRNSWVTPSVPSVGASHAIASGRWPSEGVIRSIDAAAKAIARFEKLGNPALDALRRMQGQSLASRFPNIVPQMPAIGQSRVVELLNQAPKLPAIPDRTLKQLQQALDSPMVRALNSIAKPPKI